MDETDDDMLLSGSEGDGNVRSGYEEDEGTDRKDGDSETE
jgi:hypothetical protein